MSPKDWKYVPQLCSISGKASYISIRLEVFTATNFSHIFSVWRQHQICQIRQRFKDRLRLCHWCSDIRNLMMGKRSVFQPPDKVSLSYTADFLNI